MNMARSSLLAGTLLRRLSRLERPAAADYCTGRQSDAVSIPRRIHRGPTDILQALSDTVRRDVGTPHHKFADDPFLTPLSSLTKRSYALSKEAGRKAAAYIRDEYPQLFRHRVAQPFIDAFAPLDKSDGQPASVELLVKMIDTVRVTDAVHVYKKLQENGTEVDASTKQALLELVCFYNEEDQLSEELIEERWFKLQAQAKEQSNRPQGKTWKDSGFAEKLFQDMEEKTGQAYSALICGMASHGQAEGAWEHYKRMTQGLDETELGLEADVTTLNALMGVVGAVRESAETKERLIHELLQSMAARRLRPNVGTLNAALETIATISVPKLGRDLALRVHAEFQTIGVQPSLATYYHLLNIFCRKKGGSSANILEDIVDRLERQVPTLQDPKDVLFFGRAMEVCNGYLNDVDLAGRLHRLYTQPAYESFVGSFVRENLYYRAYLQLVCRMETPDRFVELYSRVVPHLYSPEQRVFEEFVNSLKNYSAARHVPQFWNDAVRMELAGKESVLEALTESLDSDTKPATPSAVDGQVDPVLATARAIWNYVEEQIRRKEEEDRRNSDQVTWTASMLGHLISVHLRHGDFQGACVVMERVAAQQSSLRKFVSVETLQRFVDEALKRRDARPALMAVEYATGVGYPEAKAMADRIATFSGN